jgi:trehalose-6-phosphatase
MSNMERKQVNAILSDYDGTLCSTTSVRDNISLVDTISRELEQILFHVSELIPICIVSSKDFAFLHKRAKFANILSCVLGIETVIHNPHYSDNEINNLDCISQKHLIASSHSLMVNSGLLHKVMKIRSVIIIIFIFIFIITIFKD